MTDSLTSAESRLSGLIDRLLQTAESALAAGDLELAHSTAEEVRTVDPDNERAALILQRVANRQLAPLGERALMTLLFSDLVGSTFLSEQVEPEQIRDIFGFYRSAAKEAVERYSGYLMQYSGDGILAGFGYPEPHEDDARRAVLAGLDLVAAMRDARGDLERRHGVGAEVRVGVHTGRVVVTGLGQDPTVRERDSIVGAAPNLAARIQNAADPGVVVISDVTRQLVETDFFMRSIGVREFKGVSRPVEVFAVDRPRYASARFEAERYRKAGLVGRDAPRDRLIEAWEGVRTNTSETTSMHLVVGEAGIGKTRLVAELVDRVQASEGRVLGAGCLPYYSNVSLWPIGRMLERALDLASDEGERRHLLVEHLRSLGLDLARTVPFLGRLVGLADSPDYPGPELDPAAFLDETLTRLIEWLGAVSRPAPHLLVVEDLHWSDPSTVGLLQRLAAGPPPGILVVATTRDASVVPWSESVDTLNLGRLGNEAAHRLVENLSSGRELEQDLRDSIVVRAEGVPLFIEELTRSCLDEGRDDPIPLRLQELFTWRLKSPGVDLKVAQAAATVGPTFDRATVAAVVGDEELVASQIRHLLAVGVIDPGDPATDTYRFRHALQRDAAYETQVLDDRRRTHARVAAHMQESGAEPALVAQHLDLAGEASRAIALYLQAAQLEQGRGAHTEATRLLSRALELLDELPGSDERDLSELTARMLRGLSVSSMQGYAAPEVQADHRRAETLATRLGTRPEVLPSLIAIWAYWLTSGDLATAEGLIDRLGEMVARPEFAWFEPEVESCAGWLEFYRGRLESAQDRFERAVTGFRERPSDQVVSPFWPLPNDPVAVSLVALACVHTLRGELSAARLWEEEAIRRAEEIGFPRGPFSLAFVKTYAAWSRRFTGEVDAARLFGAEVVGIGQAYGYAYWMMLGSSYVATAIPGGDPDPQFLAENIAMLRAMGQEAFVASNLAYLADLVAEDPQRALELIDDALQAVHKNGEYLHLADVLRRRATLSMKKGDFAEAVGLLTEAISIAADQGARVVRLRAAIDLARLPEDVRPSEWRELLAEAARDMPAGETWPETALADDLLNR